MFMEPALVPRGVWAVEGKALQPPPELHTSVAVTRSVSSGTCFGPCALQGTFYDTIAFIAQRASDSRSKAHVFRVDPEALRNSALLLSWLRLIQAARNAEEQNAEAFLRAGQLFIRTTRDVRPEEELLLWYDPELSLLLGLVEIRGAAPDLRCSRCGQVFRHEHPFLAHCRFLCARLRTGAWSLEPTGFSKRPHRVTDFHNIARDLEQKSSSEEAADVSPKKRKHEDTLYPRNRKTVLLEKTNISNDVNISTQEPVALGDSGVDLKTRDKSGGRKDDKEVETGESSSSSSIAFSSEGELRSAFCKPHRRSAPLLTAPPGCAEEAPCRALLGYSLMSAELPLSSLHSGFHYAPLQPKPSALTALPPTLTSLGVSVQNWCAKCNLSFRMTSDLVFHMRSHHKKEFAAESHVRRRREEKLTCPICHEHFRERHHLSRHMTSHN